jgi:hypothetical protein
MNPIILIVNSIALVVILFYKNTISFGSQSKYLENQIEFNVCFTLLTKWHLVYKCIWIGLYLESMIHKLGHNILCGVNST